MARDRGVNVDRLTAEIIQRLEAAGNPERRRVAASYTPTAMRVLGVSVPDLRLVVREVGKLLRNARANEVLSLVRALLAGETLEGRQAAYEILSRHRPTLFTLKTRAVERLGKGIDNWVSVDTFACLVAGPAWRRRQVTDAAVARWAVSNNRWWRRAAVVSTVPLNQKSKGGAGDTPRTLVTCNLVSADHDDMVVKGLSWSLRELAERDSKAVKGFLEQHQTVPCRSRETRGVQQAADRPEDSKASRLIARAFPGNPRG